LFAFERLPALAVSGSVLEVAGQAAPRLGAVQTLTVHCGQR
jgi:hypothetical protein